MRDLIQILLYLLIHETGHVEDYINQATPYIGDFHKYYISKYKSGSVTNMTEFTENIWKTRVMPEYTYDFFNRTKFNFYGMDSNKSLLPNNDIPETYRTFSKTPFVSPYAGTNWAEDFAEYVTFYHLVEELNLQYTVTVLKNKKSVLQYEPMNNPAVKNRKDYIRKYIY